MEQINVPRVRHFAEGAAAFGLELLCFALLHLIGVSTLVSVGICAAAALILAVLGIILRRSGLSAGCALGIIYLIVFVLFFFEPTLDLSGTIGRFVLRADSQEQSYVSYGAVDCTLLSHNGKETESVKVRLILTDGSPQPIKPGDEIITEGKLSQTNSAKRYTQGAFLTLNQNETVPITVSPNKAQTVITRLSNFSLSLSDKIQSLIPDEEGALLAALICGDRSGFTPDYNASLRSSGLSHIAAVSGMHMSILLAIICFIFPKKAAMVISLPLMLAFAAMTGFSPSIVRALIMSSFLAVAFLIKAEYDAITSLTAAGAIIGIFNPFALCSASFLLSFFSTLGIILFSPRIMGFFSEKLPRNKLLLKFCHWLISTLAVTASATVFTLPLQMLFFPSVSLISLLSNLLATWAVSPAMFIGIFLLPIAIYVPYAQSIAVFVISLPLKYINWVIHLTGDTMRLAASSENIWLILTAVILFLGAIVLYLKKISPALFATVSLATMILSVCFAYFTATPQISIWGEGGTVCVSIANGGQVVNIGAPAEYNGAYFAKSQLSLGRKQTAILLDTSYIASGGLDPDLFDEIYSPKELIGADSLIYTESGSLDFDGFSVELLCLGDTSAARIVTDKLSLLDLSAIDPYTELPKVPKTDILVISGTYTTAPRMLTALCARISPSMVFISGSSGLSYSELYELCGCKLTFLDSAGTTKIK